MIGIIDGLIIDNTAWYLMLACCLMLEHRCVHLIGSSMWLHGRWEDFTRPDKDSDDAVHGIIGGLLTIKSRGSNDDESQMILDSQLLWGHDDSWRSRTICSRSSPMYPVDTLLGNCQPLITQRRLIIVEALVLVSWAGGRPPPQIMSSFCLVQIGWESPARCSTRSRPACRSKRSRFQSWEPSFLWSPEGFHHSFMLLRLQ